MKAITVVLAALAVGCGITKPAAPRGPDGAADELAPSLDAKAPEAATEVADAAAEVALPAECANATVPPMSLVCTGLYTNIATKTLVPEARAYTPAVPLWSDGASKQRWISLPAGQKIDNSTADEWIFPVGTKVWKEFSKDGKRVETRLWQKVSATYWVDATYAWNADESAATRSDGGDIPFDGGTYHIPTSDECQKCHRGRTDHILGFDQVLLGIAGATGLTLGQLIAEGRLSNPPAQTPLVIGDDGTGLAAPALAWLHVNCGTTCHNRNSNATAWSTGMFLRLDPTQLDGRSVKGFDSLTTTIGVPAVTVNWIGRTRIIPHDPVNSLLYQLISHRGTGNQMPPSRRASSTRPTSRSSRRGSRICPSRASLPTAGHARTAARTPRARPKATAARRIRRPARTGARRRIPPSRPTAVRPRTRRAPNPTRPAWRTPPSTRPRPMTPSTRSAPTDGQRVKLR